MRAVPILATLAFADVVLVAVGGFDPEQRAATSDLRAQLFSTVTVAGAGCVALVGLAFATRLVERHRHAAVRLLTGTLVGALYALGLLGFGAWTYLWMTPAHYPVAIVCGASALLLLWQALTTSAPEGNAP